MSGKSASPAAPAPDGDALDIDTPAPAPSSPSESQSPGPPAAPAPGSGSTAADPSDANGAGPSCAHRKKPQKKPRLQWDEQNLLSNALDKAKNNYPRIDEPKTPFHTGSEGSVSSGSAPGSPAFLSREQLVGFADLEHPQSSDDASLGASHRSVHIAEDASASSGGDSSPRSKVEFESKRKSHYKSEFPRGHPADLDDDSDDPIDAVVSRQNDDDDDDEDDINDDISPKVNGSNGISAQARPASS
jgi:Protein phosphatase inhibitor 2 (IPP-2)